MTNGKAKRISEKKGKVAVDRRRIAAKHAKKRKQIQPIVEQRIPEFLKRVMPDDECDSTIPNLPPDISPGPSDLCGGGVRYYTDPTKMHPKPERRFNVFQSIGIYVGCLMVIAIGVLGYQRIPDIADWMRAVAKAGLA